MDYLIDTGLSFSHFGILGYWVVFLFALFESLVFVGILVPGATIIIFAGFLSSEGYLHISDLIWFATMGAVVGDGISYYLGTKGTRFFHNENKFLKADHIDRGKRFFHRHGSKSIFLARFLGPLRAVVPFIAGLSKMSTGKFLFWNIVSAILWSTSHVLLGYFFGNALQAVTMWSARVGFGLAAIIIIVGIFYIVQFMKKLNNY